MYGGGYKDVKGSILHGGYKYFQIQRDKKRINKLFHHLVAEYFIGLRPDGLVIDHIDRNKLNNSVTNLRYVTQKENCNNVCRNIKRRRKQGTGTITKCRTQYVTTLTINKELLFRKYYNNYEDAKEYLELYLFIWC